MAFKDTAAAHPAGSPWEPLDGVPHLERRPRCRNGVAFTALPGWRRASPTLRFRNGVTATAEGD
jgi:hypothetical protein